jgi:MFS family permease
MTLMSLLPDEQFMSWGWRIPFLASAGLVFLGLWVRNGIDETPDFQKAKQEGQVAKMPLVETLRDHWREVLIAIGAKIVETAPFYLFSTFVVSYATSSTLQYERFDVLNAVTVATLVTTFCIPLMGLLSDYIGRVKVFIAGAVAMALFAVPYFLLLDQRSTTSLMIATVVALGLIWAPITAVLGTMFSEIFATRVRYTGITLGYQIGAALAGGTAPLIATWLMSRYDGSWVPVAVYIIVAALISIAAVSAVRVRKPE